MMNLVNIHTSESNGPIGENVVARLKRRISEAKQSGFEVRLEWLDGEDGDWCQIGKKRIIFLDSGQSASEQLTQLNSILSRAAANTTSAA